MPPPRTSLEDVNNSRIPAQRLILDELMKMQEAALEMIPAYYNKPAADFPNLRAKAIAETILASILRNRGWKVSSAPT